jgi:DNA-binding transcriptional MerR regulator
MARLSGNTLRTVRFYEEEGILRPVQRATSGHRYFEPNELQRLLLVTDLRSAGMSLGDIKGILELRERASSGKEAATEMTEALAERIEELDKRIAVLVSLRDDLTRTARIVTTCRNCSNDKRFFAGRCADCPTLAPAIAGAPTPRAFQILWGEPQDPEKSGQGTGL